MRQSWHAERHGYEQAKLLPGEFTDEEAASLAFGSATEQRRLPVILCGFFLFLGVVSYRGGFVQGNWSAAVSLSESDPCRDAVDGDECYESITWAKWHGIYAMPAAYAPCDANSSTADFQAVLHQSRPEHCPRPCTEFTVHPLPWTSPGPTWSPLFGAMLSNISNGSNTVSTTSGSSASSSTSSSSSPSGSSESASRISSSSESREARGTSTSTTSMGTTANVPLPLVNRTCHDALPTEPCYASVMWARQQGIWRYAETYPDLTTESPFEAYQEELHQQGHGRCPKPCKAAHLAKERAIRQARGPWGRRRLLQFYVYHSEGPGDAWLENVNVADLAGVMTYLHDEVVPWAERGFRKHNITRITRYKITMKTTREFFRVHKRQFGAFVKFNDGRCSRPDCGWAWQLYGYVVGCRFREIKTAPYLAFDKTRLDSNCKSEYCNASVWYSLPGVCPSKASADKDSQCRRREPGGRCANATGAADCTYSVESAGWIGLDELAGIEDYRAFSARGNREYVREIDRGVGCSFWDGRADPESSRQRIDRVKSLFQTKYPELPGCDELREPPCDFNGYYEGEFLAPTVQDTNQGRTVIAEVRKKVK